MSSIAEGSVWRHLAVAQLVVAWLSYVECDWTAPCEDPLALAITHRRNLSMSAWTPIIDLSSVQVHMSREDSSECGHGGRSILSFFIAPGLSERRDFLFREVSDIVHGDLGPGSGRLQDLGSLGVGVSVWGFQFATCWTKYRSRLGKSTLRSHSFSLYPSWVASVCTPHLGASSPLSNSFLLLYKTPFSFF